MISAAARRIYEDVIRELPRAEQRELAEAIQQQLRETEQAHRPMFRNLKGMAAHPMAGEDAQEWVTRGREDSHRGVYAIRPVED